MTNVTSYPLSGTQSTHCTIQQAHGKFCDEPMALDAPYPICAKHAGKVYTWVKTVLGAADIQALVAAGALDVADRSWPHPDTVPATIQ